MNKRPIQSRYLKLVGSTACLLAVLATLGGHWMALQSVAWVRMISQYAREGSLAGALVKTFDGRHPCALCRVVQQGRQQEQEQNKNLPGLKADPTPELLCEVRPTTVPLPPATAAPAVPFVPRWHTDFSEPPPMPPPRLATSPRRNAAGASRPVAMPGTRSDTTLYPVTAVSALASPSYLSASFFHFVFIGFCPPRAQPRRTPGSTSTPGGAAVIGYLTLHQGDVHPAAPQAGQNAAEPDLPALGCSAFFRRTRDLAAECQGG
jgi:hypothetical protein